MLRTVNRLVSRQQHPFNVLTDTSQRFPAQPQILARPGNRADVETRLSPHYYVHNPPDIHK